MQDKTLTLASSKVFTETLGSLSKIRFLKKIVKDFKKNVDNTKDYTIFVKSRIKMTEKIQLILEDIRLKCKDLHLQLELERSKNLELKTELDASKSKISELNQKNEEYIQTNMKLVSELESTIKQGIEVHVSGESNRNAQIDELVREIEHCITQLNK